MKFTVVDKIKKEGWPRKSKEYKRAHKIADRAEKRKYGRTESATIGSKIPKGELPGASTRAGEIKVSIKVPKRHRKEIAYHEKREHAILSRHRPSLTAHKAKK